MHSLQRRNGVGVNQSFPPMASDSFFSIQRRPDTTKSQSTSFLQQNYRLLGLGFVCICILLIFWRNGPNFHSVTFTEYSIVFDAGSTGSRVHVYSFLNNGLGDRILLGDDFHAIKPGLSAYAGNPEQAAQSLQPLLEAIKDSVPVGQRAQTPCQLRATAGLRLLPGEQAEDILKAVVAKLKETPYFVDDDSVSILDGKAEGAYAWLTVNYLLEKLPLTYSESAMTVDLGGGSFQQAYEIPKTPEYEQQETTTTIHAGANTKSVYVHSYLNYGLMAARSLFLNASSVLTLFKFYTCVAQGEQESNPCIPSGYSGEYKYGTTSYKVTNKEDLYPRKCKGFIKNVLDLNAPCGAPADQCTINGTWGGPRVELGVHNEIYLFSYFWDKALDSGMIVDKEASDTSIKLGAFTTKCHEICAMQFDQLKEKYTDLQEEWIAFMCMDLAYISVLLMDGLRLDPSKTVTVAKQINYRSVF